MLSCLVVKKIALYFTLLQYLSPQPDTNDSISSGFDEGPPSENEMCCDWLAVPVRCDWRTA